VFEREGQCTSDARGKRNVMGYVDGYGCWLIDSELGSE